MVENERVRGHCLPRAAPASVHYKTPAFFLVEVETGTDYCIRQRLNRTEWVQIAKEQAKVATCETMHVADNVRSSCAVTGFQLRPERRCD